MVKWKDEIEFVSRLNSATKYPSIPTYHTMQQQQGKLTESFLVMPSDVIVTEMVDGVNSRVIVLPDGSWFIGSREELLYYSEDMIFNPALGLVEHISHMASCLAKKIYEFSSEVWIFYFASFGGKYTAANKNYTNNPHEMSVRLFDVSVLDIDSEIFDWDLAKIASWRESGNQVYKNEADLQEISALLGVELTPRIKAHVELPTTLKATYEWMQELLPETLCALSNNALKHPEGIVVRTPGRELIAKLRFQDYKKALK